MIIVPKRGIVSGDNRFKDGDAYTWEATPNLGIADRRLAFYHAKVYATCLLVFALPCPDRLIMEENGTRCLMR